MSQSVQTGCSLPESALKPALALALEIEHSPMGLLMLPNEHSGTLEPVVAEGLTEEQSRRFGAQRPGIGPIGMAYAQQRRVTIRDVLSESDGSQGALREIARAVGFRGLDVVLVARVRRKLRQRGASVRLETVRGVGFRLIASD